MTDQPQGFDSWAIVELFGHQRIAGKVTEQSVGGGGMIRVDVPAIPKDSHRSEQPAFTRFYGSAAIYSITPTSEEIARLAASRLRSEPITIYIPDLMALPERSSAARDGEDFEIDDGEKPF